MRTAIVALLLVVCGLAVPSAQEDPAIRVTLLGTGNPRPTADKFGPSILVEAGSEKILLDAGRGATIRLFQIGTANMLSGITALLLTHLHSDHTVGLPDLWLTGWIFGRAVPFVVYGPAGTTALTAGLEQAYQFDVHTRRDLDERLAADGVRFDAHDIAPGIVFERGGVKVEAFVVDHGPVKPAYGYRISYAGRVVVFSGDTRYSQAVAEAARGADLLVHEVISPEVEQRRSLMADPRQTAQILAHHTTPDEAARIFAEARPRLAVYSHIVPSPATADDVLPPTRRVYQGRVEFGYDLMEIDVGREVTTRRRQVVPE